MSFASRVVGYSAPTGLPNPTSWTNRLSPGYAMTSAAYNGTNFIVGGSGPFPLPTLYSSPDGTTWTSRSVGSIQSINSAIWADSRFVVGGSGATATSTDGITWTASSQLSGTSYSTSAVNEIVYLSSYGYVIAGTSANAAVSTDGLTWTYRSGLQTAWGSSNTANCGATDGSIYCFGGSNGRIATTTDSVTWTDRNSLRTGPWSTNVVNGMAYGNGRFVVVGGTTSPVTAYSTDGITWTYNGTLPAGFGSIGARCVTWTGTFFVAGMDSGYIATSTDGITWTGISALYNLAGWSTHSVGALTNSSSITVAAGFSGGSSGRIATSP